MKANRFLLVITFLMTALVTGCKYNVTTPLWDQPYTPPASATITSVNPSSEAKGGANTITITGNNLVVGTDTTIVYFDSYEAEIVSESPTSIVVRRPNYVADSATIKVIPQDAYTEGILHGYKIDKVLDNYGGFIQNLQLGGLAVDNQENVYSIETVNKFVHQATSLIDNTILGGSDKTAQAPYCARIGPDGNLYVFENNRGIEKVDLTANTVARWTLMPAGKIIKFGDFGPGGQCYVGGTKSDLCIIPPNPPNPLTAALIQTAGSYANDQILAIRVYNGYVYVVSNPSGSSDPAKIWRNQILTDSTLGPQELVLDIGASSAFSSRVVNDITFSADGTMYLATDGKDPLLYLNPVTSQLDIYYKGILPDYAKYLAWGKGNYLYLMTGNATPAQNWTVIRLDMGAPGAPYY